jgi:catechol 2,3-dioxygenase-like lactoylglutathione lyase family enzyme
LAEERKELILASRRYAMSDLSLVHVATMLVARDLTEAVAFYRDHLQFTVVEQSEGIVLLRQETMLLYLISQSPPTPDKPAVTLEPMSTPEHTCVTLVFRVADCWATYHLLSARGVVFLTEPHSPPGGGWRCFAHDPNDYLIEIEQPLAADTSAERR